MRVLRNLHTERVLVAALVAAVVAVPVASAADQALTPHHVAQLRAVRQVAISPDGQQVAYVLSVPRSLPDQEDGPAWAELHVVGATGDSRPYVVGEQNIGTIAWTPDGKSISFLAKRDGDEHKALYVLPLSGGEARRVVEHDTDISSYSWSPDGARVAFLAKEKIDDDLKKLQDQGFNQKIFREDWRPVKVWIATPGDADAEHRALDLPGSASSLHWSPVGTRLALALAPTSLVDDSYNSRRIHLVDADSGAVEGKLDSVGKLGSMAWSPDGAHLAVVTSVDAHDPAAGRLSVGSASGGELRELLPGHEGHVRRVGWRDADTILYLADEGVWTALGEVNRDGTGRRTVVGPGRAMHTQLSVSQDGRTLAFLGDSPGHPSEVFLLGRTEREPVRRTDSNPWLGEMMLAPQEVMSYKARDGLKLEGMLMRPRGAVEGMRYPMLLVVHGGPESNFRNGWLTSYSRLGQMAATQGYVVYYPNYRGSTGRGVEFSKLSQADPAGKEFDDLVDAVDHLVNIGLVDGDKVAITGGSYGGYASAWGATYLSEHFAASVMFVGISDKISKVGTTDIPDEEYLVHARKRPWDDWQLFLDRSPIYHAGKSRTPTLILHGDKDPRVHPTQSMELYQHLKLRSKAPVRLVFYPGEGHGNRRAASRLDYSLRAMRWIDHYLRGPGGEMPAHELDYGSAVAEDSDED